MEQSAVPVPARLVRVPIKLFDLVLELCHLGDF